ncbi:hypothetical protein JQN72_00385 [Phycicoccus sp. CSK15P-2]|uniref:glycosyltransferase n=1 Tax=Phycicoccus sp. CSK15P-2 TaxID=2807627 RepID=UPI001950210F|nr:glycosyltransferase [Phycicoccus sp. CSK15P-2]MBM6402701.1 hypothetical protein [Phycicoccus sp. CSK15P-2]
MYHRTPHRGRRAFGSGDGPTLLVASTGGHLEEMVRLRERMGPQLGEVEWATFDDDQSRGVLHGEVVHHVAYIPPRGYRELLRAGLPTIRMLRRGGYRAIVSTGAGVALPFFAAGRALGIPCHYIESAARADKPSLTGSLAEHIPGVRLYSQYETLATGRWSYAGSLFDGYEAESAQAAPRGDRGAQRVVVSLGTMRTYGFRRAVERLVETLPEVTSADAEVLWQTGATDLAGLGVRGRGLIPADELRAAVAEADLVVAHGGIGSALMALDSGHAPVLLPRRARHHEHVDDHQSYICQALDARGIAVGREVSDLGVEDLWRAYNTRVGVSGDPAPLTLKVA